MALGTTVKVGWDATKVNRGMGKMQAGFRKIGSMAVSAFKAIGVAAVAALGGALLYFNKFRREIDRFGKLATRLNETPETIQRIAMASKVAGADVEVVTKGVQKFVRSLYDVATGSAEYEDALNTLNLNAKELLDLSPEQQLIRLAQAYEDAGRSGSTFAALLDLLGSRGGGELVPLLAQGADKLRESFASASVVSDEVVRKVERFNDSLTRVGFAFRASFGEAFAGAIDTMTSKLEGSEGAIKAWAENLSFIIAEAIQGNTEPIELVFTYLAQRFGEMIAAAIAQATVNVGVTGAKLAGGAGGRAMMNTFAPGMNDNLSRFDASDFQNASRGTMGSEATRAQIAALIAIERNTKETAEEIKKPTNGPDTYYPLTPSGASFP